MSSNSSLFSTTTCLLVLLKQGCERLTIMDGCSWSSCIDDVLVFMVFYGVLDVKLT